MRQSGPQIGEQLGGVDDGEVAIQADEKQEEDAAEEVDLGEIREETTLEDEQEWKKQTF